MNTKISLKDVADVTFFDLPENVQEPFESERNNLKEKSLEEIIREVAEEEGMTYEETLKLFKQGMKQAHGFKKSTKDKAKSKAKRKQAKKSRKQNR